jgi:hypothetical protein
MINKKYFFLLILLVSLGSFAEEVVLKAGTFIPTRLAQNINGNINNQGETIYFEVTEDIRVNGHTVVNKGTFVKGRITNAEGRKSLGKAGKLSLEARNLNAIDGSLIEIVKEPMSSEGRKRTGATVAHVIMWGPLGLFAKGRAARVMLDTEYDLEVKNDVDINTNIQTGQTNEETQDLDVNFSKYSKKINYAKGKLGKDFKLNINLPQSTHINSKDIQITRILDHKLPKPISPTLVNWNAKKNVFEAIFPFKEIVKYISPGISSVEVKAVLDEKTYTGETSIETKWKLK